jgi:hypothetical protein
MKMKRKFKSALVVVSSLALLGLFGCSVTITPEKLDSSSMEVLETTVFNGRTMTIFKDKESGKRIMFYGGAICVLP